MLDYNEYNDNELLDLISEGNERAKEILFKKYDRVIKIYVSKYIKLSSNIGLDFDDLYQEGLIGLENATNSFNGVDSKFSTFATVCIDRKMKTILTKANRQKNRILNSSLSLEYMNDDDTPFIDRVKDEGSLDPLLYMVEKEDVKKLNLNIKRNLSNFENEVYELLRSHFSYVEIANILDKDIKAIDNAIQRIRKKIDILIK